MSTNRYPATCVRCKENVSAQEGSLEKKRGVWEVRHIKECPDVVALSVGAIFTYNDALCCPGEIFMDEDFGIVVTMSAAPWYAYEDDVDDCTDGWEIFARAANTEEREVFAAKEKEAVIHGEKHAAVERLMEGRIDCICWEDAAACKAPHLDDTRESDRLTLKDGGVFGASIYANIPADISLPIIIHSFHGESFDSTAFKEIE